MAMASTRNIPQPLDLAPAFDALGYHPGGGVGWSLLPRRADIGGAGPFVNHLLTMAA
jgi:hypothetical protein